MIRPFDIAAALLCALAAGAGAAAPASRPDSARSARERLPEIGAARPAPLKAPEIRRARIPKGAVPELLPAVPRLDHVAVIVMENKSTEQVQNAPYIHSLLESGVFCTGSYALMHPSQPNYLALWAGSTLGVRGNGCPACA